MTRAASTAPILLLAGTLLAMCGGSTPTTPTTPGASPPTTTTTMPAASLPSVYSRFGNGVQVSMDGQTVVLRTTDLPDHPSPYWGTGNPNYEAPQAGMTVNPNRIASQVIVLRVPASPSAATPSDTPLGPIGIATNGVVLFNQYAAGRMPLTNEIFSFDRYNGHPSPSNQYHYHVEPLWLTAKGKGSFIGVLLDGFPVYGPQEETGGAPASMDTCNGHSHATADYPQGIYHYHIVSAPPYISGCFHGAAGTVAG
jgi:YHYH protein